MRANLSFKLPEDRSEFQDAQDGTALRIALQEYDNWLRGMIKYEDKEMISTEEARKKLHELLGDLDLWR